MKYFFWTVKNIYKMFFWIFLLLVFLNYFGALSGSLLFALTAFVWNLSLTVLRYRRLRGMEGVRTILRTMFSKQFYLVFVAYGCYCSPKYGVNWATDGLLPIDGLDEACQRHDRAMYDADVALGWGHIDRKEHARRKNKGDWIFLKEAITSKNYANGMYIIGLLAGFCGRIVVRSVKLVAFM